MPIPALVGDNLPPGRHVCTQDEIEQRFVLDPQFAGSKARPKIWADWQKAVTLLRGAIKVHEAWISGSFISSKVDPGDIDVTFVLSGEDRAKRPKADLQVVESFNLRRPHPLVAGMLIPAHGLSVDSYTIDWAPFNLLPGGVMSGEYGQYAGGRGYWDDWWTRVRHTPKGLPAQRQDALPERGYLEVMFDDYT